MNTTIRSITARLVLAGTIVAAGAAVVPTIASAGCTGIVVEATKDNQVINGTGCNDTFYVRRYAGVQINAGGGNDTVYAGFVGNNGTSYLFLGDGNDVVYNPSSKRVHVLAGNGNDTITGSSGYDYIDGGSGTDSAHVNTGDDYPNVENFF
jgi:Ca2+-binding RTX toxin-like protein